jgi:hypothetical protein
MEEKRETRGVRLIMRCRVRIVAVWHGMHRVGALHCLSGMWLAASGSGARVGVMASTTGQIALRNVCVSVTSAMAMCQHNANI